MTFRSWILRPRGNALAKVRVLQWGHDLSVMDTAREDDAFPVTELGFNGAMTFRSWILDALRDTLSGDANASMGP